MQRNKPYETEWSATAYDITYPNKDYEDEVAWLQGVAALHGMMSPKGILDVSAGTGRHLAAWQGRFPDSRLAGVDPSRAMLARATVNAPGVRFEEGNMTDFDLRERYDVVTCLFAAVNHLLGDDVTRGLRNFARHTNPDGLVVIEPMAPREMDGHPLDSRHLVSPDGRQHVTRLNATRIISDPGTDERIAAVEMHLSYGYTEHDGMPHVVDFAEEHLFGLYPSETYVRAMRDAGLRDIAIETPPKELRMRPVIIGHVPG